ncbi:hypothetical protein [Agrococcus jejuensis]|uniref:hypothetical protein n=1 Tax=Agrococcus jejuensis TaxID=399736 RepID=UPI0011A5745C|nr:hypothetical protein [Agrococcus jejuensis]
MAIDANGIYQYDGSEPDFPMVDTLNLGQSATSTAIASVRSQMSALDLNARQSMRKFALTRSSIADSPNRYFLALTSEDTAAASPNPFPYTYTSSGTLNGGFLLPAGTYSFDLWGTLTSNTTGRSTMSIWTGLSSGDAASGGSMLRDSSWGGVGSFTFPMVVQRIKFAAATRIWFRVEKQTGGSSNASAELIITRWEGV